MSIYNEITNDSSLTRQFYTVLSHENDFTFFFSFFLLVLTIGGLVNVTPLNVHFNFLPSGSPTWSAEHEDKLLN